MSTPTFKDLEDCSMETMRRICAENERLAARVVELERGMDARHDELVRIHGLHDAITARCEALEKVAHAADILAHDIPPGDNRKSLDAWWAIRTYANCTVCHPDADPEKQA